jgi:predicted metal-dependent phosphoesterase TrpH
MNKKCDLHVHSNFSDSDADVESIFRLASQKGLSCIALTDHDTVAGIPQAKISSKKYNVELVEAIELSAQHKDSEVHILGYFINTQNKKLQAELKNIEDFRRKRIMVMLEKLNSLGMKLDRDEFEAKIDKAIPTRLHLALHLVEKKKAKSLPEVFRKYLAPGRPAYASCFEHSAEETIRLIKDCGGLSFIAHPHAISSQAWIEEFIALGVNGLEVTYPGMSQAKSLIYRNMAKKFNLLLSGGSDYHGSYKAFNDLGIVNVPYEWVEDMKKR